MTPAIELLRKHGTEHKVHEYQHDTRSDSYGLEAADQLAADASKVFKTLIVELIDNELAVGVIPVADKLSMKALAKHLNSKKAAMASPERVERTTGYVLGGVSPIGQKKQLATVIHHSALKFDSIFVSAGKRGIEIELDPQELAELCLARFAAIVT